VCVCMYVRNISFDTVYYFPVTLLAF